MVERTGAAGKPHINYEDEIVCVGDGATGQCIPFRFATKENVSDPETLRQINEYRNRQADAEQAGYIDVSPLWQPRATDGTTGERPRLQIRSLLDLGENGQQLGDYRLDRPRFDPNNLETWFKHDRNGDDRPSLLDGRPGRGLAFPDSGFRDLMGQNDLRGMSPLNPRSDNLRDLPGLLDRNDPSRFFRNLGINGRTEQFNEAESLFRIPFRPQLQISGREPHGGDIPWQQNPAALAELSKHYEQMTPEAREHFKGLVRALKEKSITELRLVNDPRSDGGEAQAGEEQSAGDGTPAQEVKPPAEQKPEGEAAQEGERPPEQVKPADQVVPEDRPPTPEEFDAAAAEKLSPLQQAIKDSGAYTVANFGDAYKDAALHDAGVAIVVVGSDIPGSEEAVKNIKAMQEKNPNLRFMVIDRDQVNAAVQADPNNPKMKEWQSWIDKSTGGRKEVLTSIQSLTADASGHPKPEKVTSYHWNNPNVAQEISDKAKLAADATVGHKGEFRLSLTAAEAQKLAGDIAAAHKAAFDAPMTDMASMKARHEKYVRAIQLASQARPDLMAERLKAIGQLPEDQRAAELAVYDQLLNEQSALRCELGLDMVKNAHRMPTAEQKQAMLSAGNDLLRDAFGRSQDLDSPENAGFVAAMRAANVNVDELKNSAATAPRVTSDQVLQKFEKAYGLQRPAQVENPRAEYRCDSRCVQQCRGCMPCGDQARGACYRRNGCGQGSCGPTQGGCGSQSGFGGGRVIRRVLGRCR
ncbi:MAG: hypothetical protein C0507_16860 [Cyanobacteria bacterium PR.3.49]|nr:hypothetical protein [Cyanobacteria bacterium PR.3.49]